MRFRRFRSKNKENCFIINKGEKERRSEAYHTHTISALHQ